MRFGLRFTFVALVAVAIFATSGCRSDTADAPPASASATGAEAESSSTSGQAAATTTEEPTTTEEQATAEESTTANTSDEGVILLEGTTWRVMYETPLSGPRDYEMEFLSDGELLDRQPNNKTFDNDTWEQSGDRVTIRKNDGFSLYEGTVHSDGTMSGTAMSESAGEWSWAATLVN